MKNTITFSRKFNPFLLTTIFILSLGFISCNKPKDGDKNRNSDEAEYIEISENLKNYWYSGLAEISTYQLTQQRYGEARDGTAVLVYVTEDFDHEKLVKANEKKQDNYPVLKLNATKNFNTGIYPYHIMQSSFLPMENNTDVVKISASIQEWCGQSYMQLEQRNTQKVEIHSYFQQIANEKISINNAATENGIWNKLRLFPRKIDTSITKMIPSFEYLRLYNKAVKAYEVELKQKVSENTIATHLFFPSLKREVNIIQNKQEPYTIEEWTETLHVNDSIYTTTARKMAELRIDYWNKNKNEFSFLRDSLKL